MKWELAKPGFELCCVSIRLVHRERWELLTHVTDGVKNSFAPSIGVAFILARLVMLFCREKVGCPTGILPRAFSDIPRS